MKITPRRVLALWRRDPTWQPAYQELRRALGTKTAQSARLKTILNEMVRDGSLVYHRQRYELKQPPPAKPGTAPAPRQSSAGEAYTGIFSAHRNGFGFVDLAGRGPSLFIPPRRVGGALDGDLVRAGLVRRRGDDRLSGRILEVLERRRTSVRGVIRLERGESWVIPLNEKIPALFLEPDGKIPTPPPGRMVDAAITEYPQDIHTAPAGRIVREIDRPDTPEAITDHILADLQIATEFSPDARAAANKLEKRKKAPRTGPRRDLGDKPFITIDGADARDFDDAVCLERTAGGGYRLWVGIADVAEFVLPGGPFDQDAYDRGTSVYFPAGVVPMLPEVLSNNLCSLRPGEPRLTLTCEMELDGQGQVLSHEIYESQISSRARLTYPAVDDFFEGTPAALPKEARPLAPMLKEMLALSQILAEKRARRGALGFVFPEARFVLGDDNLPREILKVFPTPATRLVEQFMLEANETVAHHCADEGIPILYRVHDAPQPDRVAALREQLHNFGLTASEGEFAAPAALTALLARAAENPAREQIELAILKALAQAQYRPGNDGHFGLAATHYAHFTSPIRRFPDLLVHRAIKGWLAGKKDGGGDGTALPQAGVALSERERAAAEAEKRVARLYRVLLMESRLGEVFTAVVSGVSSRGLWVALREPFVEGFLPLAALPRGHYRLDERRGTLRGPGRGEQTAPGKRLTVLLARADRMAQELEFAFERWGWKGE